MSNLQRKTTASYGIECWLRKQELKSTTKFVSDITAEFLKSKKLPYTKFNPRYKGLFTANIANAELVQRHFEEFKLFVNEKYKKMEKIIINNVEYTINYQETKIGDSIVDKNNNTIYKASIQDADDLNWIII